MCSCCEHSNWQQFLGLSNCITDLHPERAWASGQNSLPQDAWHFFLPMCPTSRSTCIFQYMFELPRCPKWVLIITLYRFSYEPPCFIGILHCHVTCLIVSEGISGGFIPHAAGQEARPLRPMGATSQLARPDGFNGRRLERLCGWGMLVDWQHISGWWFGTLFIFPNSWDDDPIWLWYFSEGLKPSTRYIIGCKCAWPCHPCELWHLRTRPIAWFWSQWCQLPRRLT
jgi:hypothetical protein